MTPAETRVLVLAPWGRDAHVIRTVLETDGMNAEVAGDLAGLVDELEAGAGLAFITEEALTSTSVAALTSWLARQPPWSDFPLVVLAARHGSARPLHAQATLERLGNVVLLERPLHAESLLSAARSALRGRHRQHEIRRHLEEERRAAIETERLLDAERRAQEARRRATETLALALASAQLGTFHCPLPLGQVEGNATFSAHVGLPAQPGAPWPMDTFYGCAHGDDRASLHDALARAIEAREPYDIEFRTAAPDGTPRWIRAKGMAYGPAGLASTRLDGITIDITAQKALEAQRESLLTAERSARLDAEHASRMKDEFLATLSHELRTPLAAIIGWTHVLRRSQQAAPDRLRAVDTIERNARTQAKLIDDLLDMSRIISGNVGLEPERLELAPIAESVLSSLEPTAHAKRLIVQTDVGPERLTVHGDAHRLQQVIWNLVANAFKFTPAGGSVVLAVREVDGQAELSVTDSGQGVAADFLPFVFERFRQSDASSTRVHGGLGLGLAIVKNLVELHGGTAHAASDGPGLGARFSIRLPLADAGQVSAPLAPPREAAEAPCEEGHDLHGVRIVVVDDEPDLCALLLHELSECGAEVHAVGSAAEALDLVASCRPHLLISDIGMPDMDGHELMRRIRARGDEVPSIALTAFAGPEDRARALEAGFTVHIAKPVDPRAFLERVVGMVKTADATI